MNAMHIGAAALMLVGTALVGLSAAARTGGDEPGAHTTGDKTMNADPAAAKTQPAQDGMKVCELPPEQVMERLKSLIGVWDAEITFWFRPGSEPVKTTATATSTLILNGMFVETVIDGGTFGPAMGNTKWTSRSYTGYNPTTRQLEVVRMASTNPVMIVLKGAMLDGGKRTELAGQYHLMGMLCGSRDIETRVSDDEIRIESMMSFGEMPEYKGAEIVMKRKK